MELRHQYQEREKVVIPGQFDLNFYKDYNFEESKYFKINQYVSENKPDYIRWFYKDKELLPPIEYSKDSRYEKVSTMKELGKCYHVINKIRGVPYSDDDKYYEVTNMTENRLDLISLKFYGSSNYWWIIAHANFIYDALTEIKRGMKLRIPPLSSVYNYYLK